MDEVEKSLYNIAFANQDGGEGHQITLFSRVTSRKADWFTAAAESERAYSARFPSSYIPYLSPRFRSTFTRIPRSTGIAPKEPSM